MKTGSEATKIAVTHMPELTEMLVCGQVVDWAFRLIRLGGRDISRVAEGYGCPIEGPESF